MISSGWRPGALLTLLQCTNGPTTKNHLSQHVYSARLRSLTIELDLIAQLHLEQLICSTCLSFSFKTSIGFISIHRVVKNK